MSSMHVPWFNQASRMIRTSGYEWVVLVQLPQLIVGMKLSHHVCTSTIYSWAHNQIGMVLWLACHSQEVSVEGKSRDISLEGDFLLWEWNHQKNYETFLIKGGNNILLVKKKIQIPQSFAKLAMWSLDSLGAVLLLPSNLSAIHILWVRQLQIPNFHPLPC